MAIKHTFVSGKSDGTDATLVQPSNWNASHTIDAGTVGTNELASALSITDLTNSGKLLKTGVTSVGLGTGQNDYAPVGLSGSNVLKITPTANISITGLNASQIDGRVLVVENTDLTVGYAITFRHENASSAAANRFSMPDQVDSWVLTSGAVAIFIYNGTGSRWQLYSWSSNSYPKVVAGGIVATPTITTMSTDTTFTAACIATNGVRLGSSTGPQIRSGSGSPNGVVTGSPGDLYLNTAGGAATTLYVKESGAATNTGWVAK
jgi:hypothetical protein